MVIMTSFFFFLPFETTLSLHLRNPCLIEHKMVGERHDLTDQRKGTFQVLTDELAVGRNRVIDLDLLHSVIGRHTAPKVQDDSSKTVKRHVHTSMGGVRGEKLPCDLYVSPKYFVGMGEERRGSTRAQEPNPSTEHRIHSWDGVICKI